jgi:hypothetical protein
MRTAVAACRLVLRHANVSRISGTVPSLDDARAAFKPEYAEWKNGRG